ncbi:MAG: extracellular solute-binding protein [Pseudomonas mandelii]
MSESHGYAQFGTLKYPARFTHFDWVNPQAPKGGTLRVMAFGTFDTLNPYTFKGSSPVSTANFLQYGINELNEPLMVGTGQYAPSGDEPTSSYGLIAQSVEYSEDRSWVVFNLRPEARFHDGTPITAYDVAFSYRLLLKEGHPQYRTSLQEVLRVDILNPQRIRFVFKRAGNPLQILRLGELPVLPQHYWKGRDFKATTFEPPLGSGPYRITSVTPGRKIIFERVKDYWGKDLPANRGFYNFDVMTTDYYRDNTVALEALKAGQFDYWLEMSAKNWANAYNIPAVTEGRLNKEQIPNGNPTGMQGFVFNLRRPVFQDVRVRQAFTLLLDFEWTNKQLFNGAYVRTRSFFENSEMAATGLPDADQLEILSPFRGKIPEQVFSEAFQNPMTDASGMIRAQQRKAYQLLQEAGWRIVDDKMVDANGKPVTIEFLLAQTEFERVLLPFKRNLSDLGIDLVIRRVDVSQYINRVRSRDFDMIVGSFPQSNSPGNEQREFWMSAAADKPGSRNSMGLKDPVVDQLVEQLINADSRKSLVAHARALDRVLQWGYYVIPNWHIKTWRVAYWNHIGRPKVSPKYDIGTTTWWVKPDAKPAVEVEPKLQADPAGTE